MIPSKLEMIQFAAEHGLEPDEVEGHWRAGKAVWPRAVRGVNSFLPYFDAMQQNADFSLWTEEFQEFAKTLTKLIGLGQPGQRLTFTGTETVVTPDRFKWIGGEVVRDIGYRFIENTKKRKWARPKYNNTILSYREYKRT